MTRAHLIVLTAAAIATTPAIANPPLYRVTHLGNAIDVQDINEQGRVVGTAVDANGFLQGFVSGGGQPYTLLPLPDGFVSSFALGINDAGVIVGAVGEIFTPEFGKAVRWTPDGAGSYSIDFLGALPGNTGSIARDINNRGEIVGFSINTGFGVGPGVWFNAPSGVLDLTAFGISGTASEINELGVVIGGNTRLDLNTLVADTLPIPDMPGFGTFTTFLGNTINDHGTVGGTAGLATSSSQRNVPARYDDGLGWEALVGIPTVNGTAIDVNNDDTTLYFISTSALFIAFLEDGTFNANSLLAPESSDWQIFSNFSGAINDRGQIAALAINNSNNLSGAVLLTPVSTCQPDLTASTDPNDPGFGVPDGILDANDFFFYLGIFAAGDPTTDLTGSIDPNDAGFGIPDGTIDANDFFYYLDLFAQGCP